MAEVERVAVPEMVLDGVDRTAVSEMILRDPSIGEGFTRCNHGWGPEDVERMLLAGFDVPSNAVYGLSCIVCGSLDMASGLRGSDGHLLSKKAKKSESIADGVSIEVGGDLEKPKKCVIFKSGSEKVEVDQGICGCDSEKPKKRVIFKNESEMADVDKDICGCDLEAECERPYRSIFYQLVVMTVLILALTVAVAVYTVYEFRHLYPNYGDHTAPINITVWRNILNY